MCDGEAGCPLEEGAWTHAAGCRTPFPAQLPVAPLGGAQISAGGSRGGSGRGRYGSAMPHLHEPSFRHIMRYTTSEPHKFERRLDEEQVHRLLRALAGEPAASPPAGGAGSRAGTLHGAMTTTVRPPRAPPPPLPPVVEEGAEEGEAAAAAVAEATEAAVREAARMYALQGGAKMAAPVQCCPTCGRETLNWTCCEHCYESMSGTAVQAAISAIRPVLDRPAAALPPPPACASAEVGGAFTRGILDAYPVGRSGMLKESPEAFQLCNSSALPPLPPPNPALAVLGGKSEI